MAYRKRVENWLEKDCKFWAPNIDFELIDAGTSSYVWNIVHKHTRYTVVYSDSGHLRLSSCATKHASLFSVREIYLGDTSEQSFNTMIGLLSDNFAHMI